MDDLNEAEGRAAEADRCAEDACAEHDHHRFAEVVSDGRVVARVVEVTALSDSADPKAGDQEAKTGVMDPLAARERGDF